MPTTQVSMGPLTRDLLIETFHGYGCPRSKWLVGGEFERAAVRSDGAPVAYDAPDGIRWILESLAEQDGWDIVREGELPIALKKDDGASITLEPGGQVELSGAPHRTLSGLDAEMQRNRRALKALTRGKDLVFIAAGLTPIAAIEDIHWMPKGRYEIMREYLPQVGPLAHYMMKGTCSVQCNFDFSDEADAAAKMHLLAGLSPLTTALFANSPLYRNEPTGFMSYRGHIWTKTDPARTGFPPGLRADFNFERWVDYLLDVPMMFTKHGAAWRPARGMSFRTWMDQGIEGRFPDMDDWKLHETSVFPEVRIKRTIEVRGADCVDHELALAFCAMFAGLLYCRRALDEGLAFVEEIEAQGTHLERFEVAAREGLAGKVSGRALADWASDLGDIAERGLRNCLPGDMPMLTPLLQRIDDGRSPAQDLLDAWRADPRPEAVIRAVAY